MFEPQNTDTLQKERNQKMYSTEATVETVGGDWVLIN
jgi:hypothetical protein